MCHISDMDSYLVITIFQSNTVKSVINIFTAKRIYRAHVQVSQIKSSCFFFRTHSPVFVFSFVFCTFVYSTIMFHTARCASYDVSDPCFRFVCYCVASSSCVPGFLLRISTHPSVNPYALTSLWFVFNHRYSDTAQTPANANMIVYMQSNIIILHCQF